MTTDRRRRSGILIVMLAGLMGAALTAPAAAGALPVIPSDTSSGKVGVHRLVDTHATPGGRCNYGASPNYITSIHVEPPVAKARQGRTSQRIGFRYVIQGWNSVKLELENALISSFQKRTATPTSKANFTGRTGHVDGIGDDFGAYRVRVDLRWYDSSGKTVGRASMFIEHFTIRETGVPIDAHDDDGYCGDTTG